MLWLTLFALAHTAYGEFSISINSPSPCYMASEDDGTYYYDAVELEPLVFAVNVSTNRLVGSEFNVMVARGDDFFPLAGCSATECSSPQPCWSNCTASTRVDKTKDAGVYQVIASPYDQTEDQDLTVKVDVQIRSEADLRFTSFPAWSITSWDGNATLTYSASGYPRPLTYTLQCNGSWQSANTQGTFHLTNLPRGETKCNVNVTNRWLAIWSNTSVVTVIDAATIPASSAGRSSTAASGTTGTTAIPTLTAASKVASSVDASEAAKDGAFTPTVIAATTGVLVVLFVGFGAVIVVIRRKVAADHNNHTLPQLLESKDNTPRGANVVNIINNINNSQHFSNQYIAGTIICQQLPGNATPSEHGHWSHVDGCCSPGDMYEQADGGASVGADQFLSGALASPYAAEDETLAKHRILYDAQQG